MGTTVSKVALTIFELSNELFIAVAAGAGGIVVLARHSFANNNAVKSFLVSSLTIGCLVYVFQSCDMTEPTPDKIVFITGCDSGLGFSLAQHTCDLGFTVIAGFLNLNSRGAKELRKNGNMLQIELDVTNKHAIAVAVDIVSEYLQQKESRVLWAIINNAGVMVFGEFEWLTENLIEQQINVNLMGTFRVTKAFSPALRKYKCRLIVITSHCALATLPGLAVYGATKAGLQAWCDGIRVELGKYGVKVITFIPGSFVHKSNILSRQVENVYEMSASLSTEQIKFYGDYFKRYNSYLSIISCQSAPSMIDDHKLYSIFDNALMDEAPKSFYLHENMRYSIYHTIFKYAPTTIRDYFTVKFMQMPEYMPEQFIPDAIA